MGDPRKHKKKFQSPSHPWQKSRLEEEKELITAYGLKNKKEVWRSRTKLKNVADQAKMLTAATGAQAEKQKMQLVTRLSSIGVVADNARLDDVLSLSIRDFLERRLQTQLLRKQLAKSMRQARQLIVHGHVSIGNKKINVPSYLVKKEEENDISFSGNSPFADVDHPERSTSQQAAAEESAEEKPAKKETKKKPAKKREAEKAEEKKPEKKQTEDEVKNEDDKTES